MSKIYTTATAAMMLFVGSQTLSAVDYSLYNSSFPHEHYDSQASSTSPSGYGLTNPAQALTTSVQYGNPFVLLTRDPSELYLIGGMSDPVPNYISKLDPISLATLKTTSLDCPSSDCPANNVWAPSASWHANGFLYIVTESRLWKLDKDINVVSYYNLPIKEGAYNTLKVLSDGNILLKGVGTVGGTDERTSVTIVDQNLNPIIVEYILPEKVYGRISVLVRNGQEHVYMTGETTAMRFKYSSASGGQIFAQDPTWSYVYRTATDTATGPGGAMSFIGSEAYFVDNCCIPNLNPTGPMHLLRVNLDNSADKQSITPFPNFGSAYHFNKHLTDPFTGVIVVADSANGKMAGYRYQGNGVYKKLWSNNVDTKIIAAASNGYLYTTDMQARGEQVVIMDIQSGTVLKRVQTPVRTSSVGGLSVGYNKDIFYVGNPAGVIRIYNQ